MMPIRNSTQFSRRAFLSRSATAAAATSTSLLWSPAAQSQLLMPKPSTPLEEKLDAYIAAYMPAMNAPGMTLGLTDAGKTLRTAGYGFANVDQHLPVNPSHLFQIGSITKSFVALVLLQLRDEGKLDLHQPILAYLPELPISEGFGPIAVHHLLNHTSGLPDNDGVFSSDPSARLVQGFKPGDHFHYCNAGFDILGLLAVKLDGRSRSWRQCVQTRILDPLEMHETTGVIGTFSRDRMAASYQPYWDDQVYPRQGKLAPAPNLVMDTTDGCIASTPGDMARYLRMLLNRGQGPKGRIVSEESFALFSTPFIKADDFSPTSSYGYGIAVDSLNGHKILRHTGGMVSFASSIHVDLDGGVAAFASINAMQGYRPIAVTEYAVRLLRAQHEGQSLPKPAPIVDPQVIENAADYAGTFTSADGRKRVFLEQDKHLYLENPDMPEGKALPPIPLQYAGGDGFLCIYSGPESKYSTYHFRFGRESTKPAADKEKTAPPVIDVFYGPDWYVNARYSGPKSFAAPEDYAAFAGHYRSNSPWGGDARVFVLKSQLSLDGATLHRIGARLFRIGEEDWSPETAEFLQIFEGKFMILRVGGLDFSRIEVD